jgi:hypothetical protein
MIAPRKFWWLLFLITVCAVVTLPVWHALIPGTDALSPFTWICIGVFAMINVVAYFLGVRSIRSKSKYRFVHLTMALIVVKMIICIVLVVAHVELNMPGSKLFVLPFLSTYLIFTLFEIFVLEKIARIEQKDTSAHS